MATPATNAQPPVTQIKSAGDVFRALEHLGLPRPCDAAFEVLHKKESGAFKRALETVLQGQDGNGHQMNYLRGVTRCMTSSVMDALKHLGFNDVTWEVVLEIGKTKGLDLRKALSEAATSKQPERDRAMTIIKALVSEGSARENVYHIENVRSAMPPYEAVDNIGGGEAAPPPASPEAQPPRTPERRPDPAQSRSPQRQPEPAQARPPQANASRASAPPADEASSERGFKSVHVYAGKAAFCFNASETRAKNNKPGEPAIMLDAAAAIGERTYDWPNAHHILLTPDELSLILAVFMGWKNDVQLVGHGERNEKTFSIERQPGKLFAKVIVDKEIRAVPIGHKDAMGVVSLLTEQLAKANPHLRPDHLFHIVKSVCTM